MASTSEKGHAKNIANANAFNTFVNLLGPTYNPTNPDLATTNLQTIYNQANAQQTTVNNNIPPYSLAVDNRQATFNPLNKNLTLLRKAYKSTQNVTQQQLEDLMTIIRKIKGIRKNNNQPDPTSTPQQQNSVSQQSYDQRTSALDILIAQLTNTPNYNPNETQYQTATWLATQSNMLKATQQVANTFFPLAQARTIRNNTLYSNPQNLVDTFNKAKDYLFTILDHQTPEYKAFSKLKFKKIINT